MKYSSSSTRVQPAAPPIDLGRALDNTPLRDAGVAVIHWSASGYERLLLRVSDLMVPKLASSKFSGFLIEHELECDFQRNGERLTNAVVDANAHLYIEEKRTCSWGSMNLLAMSCATT